MSDFLTYLESCRGEIEDGLERVLPPDTTPPARLHEAMRYAVFAGGKRFRPALLLATAERLGADRSELLEASASLELIHTFSLVHDDLPALDDDDLRRGRQTVHVAYDEALAVLAGDALLGLGLEVLARHPRTRSAEVRVRAVAECGSALGSLGMIGGQVDDLEAEGRPERHSRELLESIHRRKTGELIVLAIRLGGLYAGASDDEDRSLARLGHLLGLIFQMVDDILDVEGDSETLGKTAGKDVQADKLTYPRLVGLEETRRLVSQARDEAQEIVLMLPGDGRVHGSLVDYLVQRRH